jgi:hypothetical protein
MTTSDRIIGQVKWFNNKVGYGFITVNDGELSGKDIFIHYSAINVTDSQYKYLVQGEYVEFTLVKSTVGSHEFQAVDISGIKGGVLMCETRRNNRPPRENGDTTSGQPPSEGTAPPQRRYNLNRQDSRGPAGGRGRGRGPARGRGQSGGRGQSSGRGPAREQVNNQSSEHAQEQVNDQAASADSAGEFTSVRRRNPKRKETVEVATA